MNYAGFWLRLVAILLDTILINLFFYIIQVLLAVFYVDILSHPLFPLIYSLAYWLYFAGMESSRAQATVGKRLMGLAVTDREGKPISFLRATARYLGKYLSVLTLFVGFLMAGFTKKKQGLHDILAGCLVVIRSQPTEEVT